MKYYDDKTKRALTIYIFIFFLLAIGIVISGYVSYRNFEHEFRHQAEHQISAIAELKVNELVYWREERLGDARFLYNNSVFSMLVDHYFKSPDDVDAQSQLLAWLEHYQVYGQYDKVRLLDVAGLERLSTLTPDLLDSHLTQDAIASLQSGEITFLDFHRDTSGSGEIHLDILVPIFADKDNNRPLGVLDLSINPQTYLYPYIQSWPISSDTAETLLVRRDGEDVLFLNRLRFGQDAPLTLRYPLTDTDLPATKAVLGQTGVVQGMDYRGEPVLADVRSVPDSPWFLISKMDTSEVYAPLRSRLWQTLLITSMAIFVAGAGLTLIWRQQRILFYRTQAETAEALRVSEEKFSKAFILSPDSININRLQDGMYVSINNGFTKITGYTADEVIGKTSLELNVWVDPQDRKTLVDGLTKNGEVENLEARFRAKNGNIIHGLMSASVLELNGVPHLINITRDITERKRTEELIKESEANLRSLINNRNESIWSLDRNYNFITFNNFFSEAYFSVYKIKLEKGMNAITILTPELQAFWKPKYDSALSGQKMAFEFSAQVGNGLNYYEVSLNPIVSDGIVTGLSAISIEITERKRVEDEFKRNVNFTNTLLDAIPTPVFYKDRGGRYQGCNQAFTEIMGVTSNEIKGKTVYDLWPNELSEVYHRKDVELMDNPQHQSYEFQVRDKNGIMHPVIYAKDVFRDEYGQVGGVVGAFIDITARKQAEDALRENEEKYRRLFDYAPLGIFQSTPDGKVISINPAFTQMLGYDSPEGAIKSIRNISTDIFADPNRRAEIIRLMAEDPDLKTFENMYRRKDGSTFIGNLNVTPVKDADGRLLRIEGIVEDITERKQAEEALRVTLAKYKTLFESFPLGISVTDETGNILEANPTAEKLLGLSQDEHVQRGIDSPEWHIVRPDGTPMPPEEFASALALKEKCAVENVEMGIVKPDNTITWLSVTAAPLPVEGYGVVITYGDITARKQAEASLTESENLYRKMNENSPLGMHFYKLEGEKLIMAGANPAADKLLGMDNSQFIGKTIDEAFPPLMQTEVPQRYREAAANGIPWSTEQITYEDGRIKGAYEVTAFQTTPQNMVAMFADITARKKAEEALQESEEMFRVAFDNAPTGMSLLSSKGFAYLAVNPLLCEMFGYTQEEFLGQTIRLVTHPDDEERSNEWIRKKYNNEPCEPEFEKRYIHKDGHIVWGLVRSQWIRNEDGSPRMAINHILDITARKQAEEALRESEALYRQAIEVAHAVPYRQSYHVNGQSVAYDFIGEGIRQITGYGPEEFTETVWDSLAQERFLLEDLTEYSFDEAIERVRSGVSPVWKCNHRIRARDGSIHWVFEAAVELRAENGVSHGSIGMFQDITERKQAEEEIRQLNLLLEQRVIERTTQLENTNKELEAFSYSVSHDLRAPLRGIDGWSQALLEDYHDQLDEQGRQYIDRVRSETQRMGHLIDDMLKLSRLTRAEMVKGQVDLSALAQAIAERLQITEPLRKVEFNIQAGLTAEGDSRLLEAVLTNLLGNAFKFTGKRTDARIEFGQTESQGQSVFFVHDNGVGFDMAYSQKMFGAFQRIHKVSEFPGTGVGLATVQRIIHRHGGRVWAEAEVGHGATFYFTLG